MTAVDLFRLLVIVAGILAISAGAWLRTSRRAA